MHCPAREDGLMKGIFPELFMTDGLISVLLKN